MKPETKQRIQELISEADHDYEGRDCWPEPIRLLYQCTVEFDSLESALADEREVVEHLKARINTTNVNTINNVADVRGQISGVMDGLVQKLNREFYTPN